MKLYKNWIYTNIFFIFVILLFGYVLSIISTKLVVFLEFNPYFIYGFLIFIILMSILFIIIEATTGDVFYSDWYISIDKFEKHLYSNVLILVYNNHANIYRDKIDKIDKLTEIKIRTYYNINKKESSVCFLPYDQI